MQIISSVIFLKNARLCGHFFLVRNMKLANGFRIGDIYSVIFLSLILAVVVLVYYPGLKGGFIFDDYPNLEDLGLYGGVVDFETFKSFVLNGFSGPLGRPISMASFLLDDNTWPTNPEWFKATNLKIHLLSGLVLSWATLNLLRLYKLGQNEASLIWIALLSGAIWMLHPYHVSTTLYVVQRMAQLAALFVFAGIAGYLHGRLLLARGHLRPAYIWMSCSLVFGTLLAVFSKENGILLPALVLTIEFCLPKSNSYLLVWWKSIFLWFPAVIVMAILIKAVNFSADAWPNRIYTQSERLLTEARILWEYLYHLYVPRIEGRGLFQDGYQFSRSLISPPITLVAWMGLVTLVVAIIKLRNRLPFLSLALLFFLASHLIESTLLNLELYFEHRNYMASAFLFLPIAILLVSLSQKNKIWISVFGATLLLTTLALLTWERSKLWSNTDKLQLYWAASTLESPRAQNKIGISLLESGNNDGAIAHMQSAIKTHPQSSFLNVGALLMKVYIKTAKPEDFAISAEKISGQPYDTQAVVGIRRVTDASIDVKSRQYLEGTLLLLKGAESNSGFMRVNVFARLVPYLRGRLYLALTEYDLAYEEFSKAIPLYAETDASLAMVAEMASAHRPVEALLLLKQAEAFFDKQPDSSLRRSRGLYESEFLRLSLILNDDISALGFSLVDKSLGQKQVE